MNMLSESSQQVVLYFKNQAGEFFTVQTAVSPELQNDLRKVSMMAIGEVEGPFDGTNITNEKLGEIYFTSIQRLLMSVNSPQSAELKTSTLTRATILSGPGVGTVLISKELSTPRDLIEMTEKGITPKILH